MPRVRLTLPAALCAGLLVLAACATVAPPGGQPYDHAGLVVMRDLVVREEGTLTLSPPAG